ncbi:major capsid protein [Microviridae sp.]|nr:major capsid protein [Microviridae sp.]
MNPFQSIQVRKPKTNKFDLSHERKMSVNFGNLYPMLLEEIIPGDNFKVKSEIFIRLAPLLSPVMHRINVYSHYFFVPNRLVWSEWEDFITGGEDGTANPTFPTTTINQPYWTRFQQGTLADYFGLPITEAGMTGGIDTDISLIPFRAYQLIYNEYYRDQNLVTKVPITKNSGNVAQTTTEGLETVTLRERAWEKDYLTSCLPWAQRGGAAAAPLDVTPTYLDTSLAYQSDGTQTTGDITTNSGQVLVNNSAGRIENLGEFSGEVLINDLRKATRLQEWLEKQARGGSRYIETILSHFGVRSSNKALQRPQYLGGSSQPVTISEVLQTAEGTNPVAEMYGHGISVGGGHGFKRSFEEHGYIIGILSITPKTAYQNGLARTWRKFDKFDYYWPEFAHLGEQEVTQSEAYYTWKDTSDLTTTFGYQQRYAEYKYKESIVSGDFRTNLAFWHLGRIFTEKPFLNETFITCRPRYDVFSVIDETVDHFYVQIYHKISALRPIPYFSIPTL